MEEEILPELKPLIIRMLDNIKPRYVPLPQPVRRQLILFASLGVLLVIAVYIAVKVRSWATWRRQERERLATFDELLPLIKKDLGLDAKRTKAESRPAGEGDAQPKQDLVDRCVSLGEEIDKHTNRWKNSKIVAMLAYRIAQRTKMSNGQAAICFCCALVADAGLLDIPRQLFFREILSSKERKQLRDQCKAFIYHMDFIPDNYRKFFSEAGLCRKENMDGSGYPEGIRGAAIPVLARIIRAAEDFTAMTERKSQKYWIPLSRKAAIKEMKRSTDKYDQRIVNILEKVI
ncbi:MAG: hypothetical protein K6G18_03650 [Treponema sp.]|nr:hypothetical protein [Treponema sp.]